jgi:hypothetical protein
MKWWDNLTSLFSNVAEPEEAVAEGWATLSIDYSQEQIDTICKAFDLEHSNKIVYISQEEFQYVPEDIQEKVKVSVFVGNTITEKLKEEADVQP